MEARFGPTLQAFYQEHAASVCHYRIGDDLPPPLIGLDPAAGQEFACLEQ
jgi:hypothetical protein